MRIKLGSRNRITLPKALAEVIGPAEYVGIEVRDGTIVLTPASTSRGDLARQRLANLRLDADDIAAAMRWSGRPTD
jgi:bifunctional DNA-binding transcriptional regulator/antitoxin component of YhaV-PrlF toxin-antitoxin module